jgi:hypothetical protein
MRDIDKETDHLKDTLSLIDGVIYLLGRTKDRIQREWDEILKLRGEYGKK